MDFSILIPVYNSVNSLLELSQKLIDFFETYEFEIIYIDDSSTDGSLTLINELATANSNIKCVPLAKNYGQQKALFCGLFFATGEYIITMDDDLQHQVEYLQTMIDKAIEGTDLVYGVSKVSDAKSFRNLGSRLRENFFKNNFKNIGNNRVSSFRVFTKELQIKALTCNYNFIYLSPILLKATNNIGNVQIISQKRKYGKSGYTIKKLAILFINLYIYYSKYSIEHFKRKSGTFVIKKLINIKEVNGYKKDNDTWGWQLSVRSH